MTTTTIMTGTSYGLIYGASVMTAPNGDIYVVNNQYTCMFIHKSTDGGATFTRVATGTYIDVHGSQFMRCIDAAIDSDGVIHVVSIPDDTDTRDLAYNTYNTTGSSWGSWAEAAAMSYAPVNAEVCISLDTNKKPHVLYTDRGKVGGTYYRYIKYTNKVGASWLTPELVSPVETNNDRPALIVTDSNVVEVCYLRIYMQRQTRSGGTWSGETAFTTTSVVYSRRRMIIKDGTVYVYSQKSASPYTAYENDGVSMGVAAAVSALFQTGAALVGSTKVFVFKNYTGSKLSYVLDTGSGWGSAVELATETLTYNITEWQPNFEYQSNRVNVIFSDTTGSIYFTYVDLTPPSSGIAKRPQVVVMF